MSTDSTCTLYDDSRVRKTFLFINICIKRRYVCHYLCIRVCVLSVVKQKIYIHCDYY